MTINPRLGLAVSNQFLTPSPEGKTLASRADVLELKHWPPPDWLPERPWRFHWGLGPVDDQFSTGLLEGGLGQFLSQNQGQIELFSFDLGPAAASSLGLLPLGPTLSPGEIFRRSQKNLALARQFHSGPLAAENYNFYPTGLYGPVTRPGFIKGYLNKFALGLVLDLAHAAVTAANLNIDPWLYLEALPLEKVVEIHLSRPLLKKPWAVDAHLAPRPEEFAGLEKLLASGRLSGSPLVLLEYYGPLAELAPLQERLADLIKPAPSSGAFGAGGGRRPPWASQPAQRLARKNAFDGSLVWGTAKFNGLTGRSQHRRNQPPWPIDPHTGRLPAALTTPRPCPICVRPPETETPPARELFVKDGFPHLKCSACGLIYVNPVLTPEAQTAYWREERGWFQVLAAAPQIKVDRLKYNYGLDLAEAYVTGRKLLDVGTGGGLFLQTARDRGWLAQGVELHQPSVARLKKEGFAIIDRPFEELSPEDGFDLVCFWEVLEHLPQPGPALEKARDLLVAGGLLLVLVPNANSLITRLLHHQSQTFGGHSHVNHFNIDNLTRLLTSSGFETLEGETLLTELGAIINHLEFEDPYAGEAAASWPGLTPACLHRHLLGSRLFILARKPL